MKKDNVASTEFLFFIMEIQKKIAMICDICHVNISKCLKGLQKDQQQIATIYKVRESCKPSKYKVSESCKASKYKVRESC